MQIAQDARRGRLARWMAFICASACMCILYSHIYEIWRSDTSIYDPYAAIIGVEFVAGFCDAYREDAGHYPNSIEELLAHGGAGFERLRRCGVNDDSDCTVDVWGNRMRIVAYDARTGHGKVVSLGRDGVEGGDGGDRDIEARFPIGENAKWNARLYSSVPMPPNR